MATRPLDVRWHWGAGSSRLLMRSLAPLGVLIFLIGLVDNLNFTVDDSYISLRYAEQFAAGHGLVYNVGERVEGISNLLWTLLLGGAARAGWNQHAEDFALLRVAKLMGAGFGLLTMVLLWWVTTRKRDAFDLPGHRGLLSVAVLGAGTSFTYSLWAVSGLETAMASFVVTLAGVLFALGLRAEESRSGAGRRMMLAGGALFGVHAALRPEGIFVWAVAMVVVGLTSPARVRSAIAIAAVPTLALELALMIGRFAYYHEWIANSVVAKAGGGLVFFVLGLKYALSSVIGTVGVLGVGLLGLGALTRLGGAWRFLLCYCSVYLLMIVAGGGDWMPAYRLLNPSLGLLWLVCAGGLAAFLHGKVAEDRGWTVAILLVVLLVGSFAGGRFLARAQWTFPTGLKEVRWDSSPARVRVAKELRSILAPGDTLALFEAGCIPYFNPDAYVMDLSGLMEPRIARMPGRHMFKLTEAYFLERSPRYYLVMLVLGRPSGDGLVLLPSPEFQRRYELVRYMEGRKRGLASVMAGEQPPPLEGDADFALFRRR